MSEMTNFDRVSRAITALQAYTKQDPDKATALRDLLSDLRHYCDEYAIDFSHELETATDNYLAEA